MNIQTFYERYPYPPPVTNLDAYRARWQDGARRRAEFHLLWPEKPYREDFSVLVAGCGTSQAAKHALRWPDARVTAIDISATSLEHTQRLKEKYALANLDILALPLEDARALGGDFDHIVCTGVLHHLEDPDVGLAALRAALAPGGALHLMVYAPYGRQGLTMLQEFFRHLGVFACDAAIGDAAAALEVLPPSHPLRRLLRQSPDFADSAALADALLNPRERAYSVPELFAWLTRNGLTFARWLRQAPYDLDVGLLARLPHTLRTASVGRDDRYAAAELFRGDMLQHSLIVRRDDETSAPIAFSSDAWLRYVPLRLPDTIAVKERLPPGSAAVLINRAHTHTDIVLPLDARALTLVDAIDGVRSIAEAVAFARERELVAARMLFETLWRHDQIVFDASLSSPALRAGEVARAKGA